MSLTQVPPPVVQIDVVELTERRFNMVPTAPNVSMWLGQITEQQSPFP
jgi:hypothetical protein